ncbi:MAG: hypothetical protein M1828_000119 [Chrysothrix sp. TS-e1954]|nr:MAG: hypothetical protein M1828_000119 [Chrysothrix sp. TS-e1954]
MHVRFGSWFSLAARNISPDVIDTFLEEKHAAFELFMVAERLRSACIEALYLNMKQLRLVDEQVTTVDRDMVTETIHEVDREVQLARESIDRAFGSNLSALETQIPDQTVKRIFMVDRLLKDFDANVVRPLALTIDEHRPASLQLRGSIIENAKEIGRLLEDTMKPQDDYADSETETEPTKLLISRREHKEDHRVRFENDRPSYRKRPSANGTKQKFELRVVPPSSSREVPSSHGSGARGRLSQFIREYLTNDAEGRHLHPNKHANLAHEMITEHPPTESKGGWSLRSPFRNLITIGRVRAGIPKREDK